MTPRGRLAMRISRIAVVLSVVVVLVSVMVASGFRNVLRQKGVELLDYARVKYESPLFAGLGTAELDAEQIEGVERIIAPQRLHPVVEAQGVLLSGTNILPVLVKGVEGAGNSEQGIMISKSAAKELAVSKGDVVEIMATEQLFAKRLRVDSVYSSGMGDIELSLCEVSVSMARSLAGLDSTEVSYYAIEREVDMAELQEYADEQGLYVEGVEERAQQVFAWLDMIDNNMTLVLLIMVIVAVINIVSSTLIVMLDNTRRVAVLRSLGMNRKAIKNVYFRNLYNRGLSRSTIWGLFIALLFGFAQQRWGLITLDEAAYFVDRVPVDMDFYRLIVCFLAMELAVMTSISIPLEVISKISIVKALKYD